MQALTELNYEIVSFIDKYSEDPGSFESFGVPSYQNIILCHGCNSFHVMGSGIALAISTKWPEALAACKANPEPYVALGTWTETPYREYGKVMFKIVNFYSQFHYGRYHKHFDYREFMEGMARYSKHFESENALHIFPRIGCGTGKATWDRIKPILEKKLNLNYIIVDLE